MVIGGWPVWVSPNIPKTVVNLLACWEGHFRRHCSGEIWKLVSLCIMLFIQIERNVWNFEGV